MEFLPYTNVQKALDELGVAERIENDRLHLTLREGRAGAPAKPATVACGPTAREGRWVLSRSDQTGEVVERLLQGAHVTDFAMLPASKWGPILDVIAFDLAANEDWLGVDADASLHQHTREPLVMSGKHRSLVRAVLESIHRGGEGGSGLDMYVVSLESPLVIEARGGGEIEFQCPEASADRLIQHLKGR